jgi:hypothetical protein
MAGGDCGAVERELSRELGQPSRDDERRGEWISHVNKRTFQRTKIVLILYTGGV